MGQLHRAVVDGDEAGPGQPLDQRGGGARIRGGHELVRGDPAPRVRPPVAQRDQAQEDPAQDHALAVVAAREDLIGGAGDGVREQQASW